MAGFSLATLRMGGGGGGSKEINLAKVNFSKVYAVREGRRTARPWTSLLPLPTFPPKIFRVVSMPGELNH